MLFELLWWSVPLPHDGLSYILRRLLLDLRHGRAELSDNLLQSHQGLANLATVADVAVVFTVLRVRDVHAAADRASDVWHRVRMLPRFRQDSSRLHARRVGMQLRLGCAPALLFGLRFRVERGREGDCLLPSLRGRGLLLF